MDTEDLRHQIKQMGDLLALCLTEQRAVLAKFEQVSADLSAVPRPWSRSVPHWDQPTHGHEVQRRQGIRLNPRS